MIYQSQFDQFERTPAAAHLPWLRPLRRSAMLRFGELGFPTTRDEDWKYTNVAPLAKVPFKLAPRTANGLTARALGEFMFPELPSCNLVFINGNYSETLSSLCRLPTGVRAMSLLRSAAADRADLEPHLAQLAGYQASAFAALNTAFVADGAFVQVPDGIVLEGVIHLIYVSTTRDGAIMSHPRNLIVVGRGSQVRVVESYVGLDDRVYFTNAVTEIAAGDGSVIEHYKLQRESTEAFHVATLQAVLGHGSSLTSHSVLLGGSLVRNDLRVALGGEGSECTLDGLYLARGAQHMDNCTFVEHAKPHSNSRQLFKGVLDGNSSGVFNGRIIVRPDAQKTDARQTNKNLLLSDNATVDTKPQLEIYADDVKCTHGATIGKLDEEALFYLRSRGIGEAAARTLLTCAFASEISNRMKIKPIQCQIDLLLLSRLSRDAQSKEAS
jgi:Fe-S cluster assembly protein SufD